MIRPLTSGLPSGTRKIRADGCRLRFGHGRHVAQGRFADVADQNEILGFFDDAFIVGNRRVPQLSRAHRPRGGKFFVRRNLGLIDFDDQIQGRLRVHRVVAGPFGDPFFELRDHIGRERRFAQRHPLAGGAFELLQQQTVGRAARLDFVAAISAL